MARVDAAGMVDKWQRRTKAATQDMATGVKNVKTAPGVKAAAAQATMLNNFTARVNDGTWANNVSKVSLTDWQNAMSTKGVPRVAAGVDAAVPKAQAIFAQVLAAVDAATAVVNQTPRGDINTNIQRAVTFMTEMSKRAPKRAK